MDKDERRYFIINSARELFGRYGISKTTMDEIASACHMSKSTLYYYFKDKRDIFKAVIDTELNTFKKKMDEILAKETDPKGKLKAFVTARFIYLKELVNYYSTLKDDYLKHYAFVERERMSFTNWEIQTIQSILDEGIEKGIFRSTDSKLTAVVIVYALKGLESPWTIERDIIEIEQAVDLMLPVLFTGIEKR